MRVFFLTDPFAGFKLLKSIFSLLKN